MRKRIAAGIAVPLVVTVGVVGALSTLTDRSWSDGSRHGRWTAVFTGYGEIHGDDTRVELAPRTARDATRTHAALVVTRETYVDLALSLSVRTEEQLRTGDPNVWEVGWVLWQYESPERFYAVTLKPNGWEVSKQDPRYPRGQRFLASGTFPTFAVGSRHTVGVVQIGNRMKVSANGNLLTTITDTEDPYLSGAVGLYCEDARVSFDDVRILALPTDPKESSGS